MAIKIKHRDPRSTDFSPKDIVDFLNLSSSIIITGSITPKNDIFNLGNSTNKWKEIVATTGSFDLIVFDGGSF